MGECGTTQDWLARPIDNGTEQDQFPHQVNINSVKDVYYTKQKQVEVPFLWKIRWTMFVTQTSVFPHGGNIAYTMLHWACAATFPSTCEGTFGSHVFWLRRGAPEQ